MENLALPIYAVEQGFLHDDAEVELGYPSATYVVEQGLSLGRVMVGQGLASTINVSV